jgi:hypothetical protein
LAYSFSWTNTDRELSQINRTWSTSTLAHKKTNGPMMIE